MSRVWVKNEMKSRIDLKILLILTLAGGLAGCETTRQSSTNNIGAQTTTVKNTNFNKEKAAANRVNNGLTYLNVGNFERAKYHLDKAAEYSPGSGDVNYALGIYFQRVREYDNAEAYFKKALNVDDKNPIYLNAYGAFLCEANQFADAYRLFDRAIAIPTYSDVAYAFYNVGFCALKQQDQEKAEDYFRKALNRNRNMPDALIEMAKIEFSKDRYERAISYLKRFEKEGRITAESAWIGLRSAHFMRDKDEIARYGVILEQKFPDSEETAAYLDEKQKWM